MKVRRPRIVSSTLLFYIDIRALTSTMNFLKPTRRPAVILMKAAWHHHHSIRSKFLHPHQGCLWPPVPPQPPLLPHLHPEARAAPANLSPPWPLWSGIRWKLTLERSVTFNSSIWPRSRLSFLSAQEVPKEAYSHSLSASSCRTSTGSTMLADFLALWPQPNCLISLSFNFLNPQMVWATVCKCFGLRTPLPS